MARTNKYKQNQTKEYAFEKFSTINIITRRILRHGKKKLADKILQKCYQWIQDKTEQDALVIIEMAIRNTTPSVAIKTRRFRGAVYPIPVELEMNQGIPRAIGWIVSAAKQRSGNTFALKLANEFIDASKKSGAAFNKKQEVQKIADANARKK